MSRRSCEARTACQRRKTGAETLRRRCCTRAEAPGAGIQPPRPAVGGHTPDAPGATTSSAPSAASAATTPRSAARTGCWTHPGWRDTGVCTPYLCRTGAAAGGEQKVRAKATGESNAAAAAAADTHWAASLLCASSIAESGAAPAPSAPAARRPGLCTASRTASPATAATAAPSLVPTSRHPELCLQSPNSWEWPHRCRLYVRICSSPPPRAQLHALAREARMQLGLVGWECD